MSDALVLRFKPSRVEGIEGVTLVAIYPEKLEMLSFDRWVVFRLVDIAQWPRPRFFWRFLYRYGRRPRWLPVADRDWFHPPSERFFRFYTKPPIVIYLPDEPKETKPMESLFHKIQFIMQDGGFHSYDLG